MNDFDFFINLIISTIGSLIAIVLVSVWSYFKWLKPFYELKKSGIIKVYENQKKAELSILKAIKSSNNIHTLTVKGETFSNKTNKIGNSLLSNVNIIQHYLISDTKEKNSYIKTREDELPKSENPLSVSLENSYNLFIAAKQNNSSITIKRHCEIVRFRIIILDNCLFLSFQEKNKGGKDCQMLQISKQSPIYQTYRTYFDDLWTKY